MAWIEAEIGRTLDGIKNFMEETQTEKEQKGDFLRKHQKLIMWLTHSEFILGADTRRQH
jgi:hypothetical protein